MCWFVRSPPAEARAYLDRVYPDIATVDEVCLIAGDCGYRVIENAVDSHGFQGAVIRGVAANLLIVGAVTSIGALLLSAQPLLVKLGDWAWTLVAGSSRLTARTTAETAHNNHLNIMFMRSPLVVGVNSRGIDYPVIYHYCFGKRRLVYRLTRPDVSKKILTKSI